MKGKTIKALTVVAILCCVAVGAFFFSRSSKEADRQKQIDSFAQEANELIKEMREKTSASAPVNWIYDRDGNRFMSLVLSDSQQGVHGTPSIIADALQSKYGSNTNDYVIVNWCAETGRQTAELAMEGYRKCLSDASDVSSIDYLATISKVDKRFNGFEDAALQLFGCTLSKVNEQQQQYLADMFLAQDFNSTQWLEQHGVSSKDIGLLSLDDSSNSIGSLIIAELNRIEGLDLQHQGYSVQVSVSSQQQQKVQDLVDSCMRREIELNPNSSYMVDCSVIALDAATGLVRVYVPSRSNAASAKVFGMNAANFLANFAELERKFSEEGLYPYSLIEVQGASGDKSLATLHDRFSTLSLVSEKSGKFSNASEILQQMLMSDAPVANLIVRVADRSGNTVYSGGYKGDGKHVAYWDDTKLYNFFESNGLHDRVVVKSTFDTGCVTMYSTLDYTLLVIGGSSAVGSVLSEQSKDTINEMAISVINEVATYYPKPHDYLYAPIVMDESAVQAYRDNIALFQKYFVTMTDKLRAMEIVSTESADNFVKLYDYSVNYLSKFASSITADYAEQMRHELETIRVSKVAELLKYSY